MAHRNAELSRLNSDLANLQTSTKLPIVLLGRDLTIRRFSAPAEKLFNLLASDVGRPIAGIRHNLFLPPSTAGIHPPMRQSLSLEDLVREVIDTLREQERDVQDNNGQWHSLRLRPYMTHDNKVDGAVLVLVNIENLKRAEGKAKSARDYAEAIIRTARDPLMILRADLRVNTANEAFYTSFKTTPDNTEGRLIFDLGNQQWNIPRLRSFLEDILPRKSFFNDFEVTHDFPDIGRRTMLLNARRVVQDDGGPQMILLAIEDVTERQRLDERVRVSEIRFRRLFEAARDGVLILDSISRKITDANAFILDLLEYTRAELLGKELWQIGLLNDEQASHAAFRELLQNGQIRYEDLPLQTKSGRTREVEVIANIYDENGRTVVQCNIRDITERKHAQEALAQAHAELKAHSEELARFNSAAVGRELRMIELKKEINELCHRQGQPARYPLDPSQDDK